MGHIFNVYLIQPFFNVLIMIYNFLPWPDIGVATIVLTFLIRLVLFPVFYKGTKQQIVMNRLQPELQRIQKEYKGDKEKQVKAQMALYKEHKVNPLGSCLLTLIQIPIIIAVYRVFLNGFSVERMSQLYHFVHQPTIINSVFLGLANLSKPNFILVIISAALQFYSTKMIMPSKTQTPKDAEPSQKMTMMLQKQMLFIGPVMTLIILAPLPSIISLYWSATTVFSIFQQWLIQRTLKVETQKALPAKEN